MIKKTPEPERPRERCLTQGARVLSLRECLALILGSGPSGVGCMGVASSILSRPGSGLDPSEQERAFFTAMEVAPETALREISGLGPAGQSKLLAAFELGRRYASYRESASGGRRQLRLEIDKTATLALAKLTKDLRTNPQEWIGFVAVHKNGKLGEFCLVEKGARTHVNFDTTEFFARLLALRPRAFFLFHNHPSGVLAFSNDDRELTTHIAQLSKNFGIRLIGHWLVTARGELWVDG